MHDNYRERVLEHRRHKDRDRERDYQRRHRDQHNYMQVGKRNYAQVISELHVLILTGDSGAHFK